jgi:hypothetical protein
MAAELTADQLACPHRRTTTMTTGHWWVWMGEYDDDFEEADVCMDCGATLEALPQPAIDDGESIQ